MKRAVLLLFAASLFACASGGDGRGGNAQTSGDRPNVQVHVASTNLTSDLRFAGPVGIRFAIEIANPSTEVVTLRKIEIHTVASGALTMRSTSLPFNEEIAPGQTETVEVNGDATSAGGHFASEEPVSFRGTAYFDSPKGAISKVFQDVLRVQ